MCLLFFHGFQIFQNGLSIACSISAEGNTVLKILVRKMSTGFSFSTELLTANPPGQRQIDSKGGLRWSKGWVLQYVFLFVTLSGERATSGCQTGQLLSLSLILIFFVMVVYIVHSRECIKHPYSLQKSNKTNTHASTPRMGNRIFQ